MAPENRRRKNSVLIRMDNDEYSQFRSKLIESGLSQQDYLVGAVCGAQIQSSEAISVLKDISKTFADIQLNIRDLSKAMNLIAENTGKNSNIADIQELQELSQKFNSYRKDSDAIWQSLRSSIAQQSQCRL